MKSISIRSVAAVLAIVATASVLKGIAVLAHVGAGAGLPLIVLPSVEVVATKPEEAERIFSKWAPGARPL